MSIPLASSYEIRCNTASRNQPPKIPQIEIQINICYALTMSMGGMLTQMIALRHPERVCGIVLLSSMYFAAGAEIQAPALIIHGTEDVVIPCIHGEMLARAIPDSALYLMEGAVYELNPQDYIPVAEQIVNRFAP